MAKKIVAGNWKMHKNAPETAKLLSEIIEKLPNTDTEVVLAPTFVNLAQAVTLSQNTTVKIAAQNMHQAEAGAYTGEISANMLTSIGVNTVILGHSESRQYFGETDGNLVAKVDTAIKHNMTVIYCIGEQLSDRTKNNHFNVVEYQLRDGLFHLEKQNWKNIVIAYEPVWAIGTGETATPAQAQEMHAHIRGVIEKSYGKDLAQQVSILYGGSVKASNAKEIFGQPDVDGGLIGGAALIADDFIEIVKAI